MKTKYRTTKTMSTARITYRENHVRREPRGPRELRGDIHRDEENHEENHENQVENYQVQGDSEYHENEENHEEHGTLVTQEDHE